MCRTGILQRGRGPDPIKVIGASAVPLDGLHQRAQRALAQARLFASLGGGRAFLATGAGLASRTGLGRGAALGGLIFLGLLGIVLRLLAPPRLRDDVFGQLARRFLVLDALPVLLGNNPAGDELPQPMASHV